MVHLFEQWYKIVLQFVQLKNINNDDEYEVDNNDINYLI